MNDGVPGEFPGKGEVSRSRGSPDEEGSSGEGKKVAW